MPIDITMPALSPTMETGTLAKWLVKVGDAVKSGDILCEIETDKATMEVESIDEGQVAELLVADGTEDIKVGAVIARLSGEGEASTTSAPLPLAAAGGEVAAPLPSPPATPQPPAPTSGTGDAPAPPRGEGDPSGDAARRGEGTDAAPSVSTDAKPAAAEPQPAPVGYGDPAGGDARPAGDPTGAPGERLNASPLARRLAAAANVDLATLTGSGPHGRIVMADVDAANAAPRAAANTSTASPRVAPAAEPSEVPAAQVSRDRPAPVSAPVAGTAALPPPTGVPMEAVKLSNMRRTIARRLTESKATVPHFYLTVDVRLDAMLKLRGELNKSLEATGIKLSVNDLLIKALGLALTAVPDANVQFAGDTLYRFARADISVAVALPTGLITPIIADAANMRLSVIASEMKDLAARAKDGKLKPEEYQGGTASLTNLGMYGIKQFDGVINPPQAMILAVGAGEPRPYVVDNAIAIATVMSATGSFDHRAIDGAVGAQLMSAFKALVENPLGMLA